MAEIVKTPGTCGGRARLEGTRMPVWCLVTYWLGGMSDEDLLDTYPHYTQDQLEAAKTYAAENWPEIQQDLWDQEYRDVPVVFEPTGRISLEVDDDGR